MEKNLRDLLETSCNFERLSDYLSDEKKLKEYLLKHFYQIFYSLFVEEATSQKLIGKNNLFSGVAYLWSYKFDMNLGSYNFPEEMRLNPALKAILDFYTSRSLSGCHFEISSKLSRNKQLIIYKRGTLNEVKIDLNQLNNEIILPEDILFPDEIMPNNYKSQVTIKKSLETAEQQLEKMLESAEMNFFYEYLVKKFESLLGVDLKNYRPKSEILKLFSPRLINKEWQIAYRFNCNLVSGIPSNEVLLHLKYPLSKEQIFALQFICNYVYGKLALSELGLFREDVKFKQLFTLFNNAFEELLKKQ